MSIEVQNITKLYKDQKALNDVSFKVNDAEIVGFLGPNGAGKSTMMKILTTYIEASDGSAKVNGFNVENGCLRKLSILLTIVLTINSFETEILTQMITSLWQITNQ